VFKWDESDVPQFFGTGICSAKAVRLSNGWVRIPNSPGGLSALGRRGEEDWGRSRSTAKQSVPMVLAGGMRLHRPADVAGKYLSSKDL